MISLLKSPKATLIVLTLALLAQLPHAAEVFMIAGGVHGVWGWLHGLSYAIALELAVLLFVVQERRNESYGFALVSVLVNLAYYAERVSLFSVQALPAWLISLALPVAIALYSHAIADDSSTVHAPDWIQLMVRKLRMSVIGEQADAVDDAHVVADDSADSSAHVVASPYATTNMQLDAVDQQIVDAVRAGNHTVYAISRVVDCSQTTLRRKRDGEYIGRIPQLVASGVLRNGSGDNGNEYRLVE